MKSLCIATCITAWYLLCPHFSSAQTRIAVDISSLNEGWTDAIYTLFVDNAENYEHITLSDSAQAELVIKITAVDLRAVKAFTVVLTRKEGDNLIYLRDTMRIGSQTAEAAVASLEWINRQLAAMNEQ